MELEKMSASRETSKNDDEIYASFQLQKKLLSISMKGLVVELCKYCSSEEIDMNFDMIRRRLGELCKYYPLEMIISEFFEQVNQLFEWEEKAEIGEWIKFSDSITCHEIPVTTKDVIIYKNHPMQNKNSNIKCASNIARIIKEVRYWFTGLNRRADDRISYLINIKVRFPLEILPSLLQANYQSINFIDSNMGEFASFDSAHDWPISYDSFFSLNHHQSYLARKRFQRNRWRNNFIDSNMGEFASFDSAHDWPMSYHSVLSFNIYQSYLPRRQSFQQNRRRNNFIDSNMGEFASFDSAHDWPMSYDSVLSFNLHQSYLARRQSFQQNRWRDNRSWGISSGHVEGLIINKDHTTALSANAAANASMTQSVPGEVCIDIDINFPNINADRTAILNPILQTHQSTEKWAKLAELVLPISASAGYTSSSNLAKASNVAAFIASLTAISLHGTAARAAASRFLAKFAAIACAAGTLAVIGKDLPHEYIWVAGVAFLIPAAVVAFA